LVPIKGAATKALNYLRTPTAANKYKPPLHLAAKAIKKRLLQHKIVVYTGATPTPSQLRVYDIMYLVILRSSFVYPSFIIRYKTNKKKAQNSSPTLLLYSLGAPSP